MGARGGVRGLYTSGVTKGLSENHRPCAEPDAVGAFFWPSDQRERVDANDSQRRGSGNDLGEYK